MRKKSSRFDINPLIGVVMALGLIGAGHVLEGGRMGSLAQFAAGLIVFGGTLGAVLISFSFADLRTRDRAPCATCSSIRRRTPRT